MPFLLLVKSHALFPNSEKYVVEIRLSPFWETHPKLVWSHACECGFSRWEKEQRESVQNQSSQSAVNNYIQFKGRRNADKTFAGLSFPLDFFHC